MSDKRGFDPVTGAWNDSLAGDLLWSRNNFGEARPDVMSPFTYSISEKVWGEISPLPGYQLSGNICGRYYANVSFSLSMLTALGKSKEAAIGQMRDLLGSVPPDLEIPTVPLSRWTMLRALPNMIKVGFQEKGGAKGVPQFLASNAADCRALRRQIRETHSKAALLALWENEIAPRLIDGVWLLGGATQPLEATRPLRDKLVGLVGEADANALFSNLSQQGSDPGPENGAGPGAGLLASLGPVVGVARVVQGRMSRAEYLETYGHRGPHEAELSMPRPAEDPAWLDRLLAEYAQDPVDVDDLLARRRAEFEAAWQRLEGRHPRQAQKLRREIDKIGPAARQREAVRDELTRFLWVERAWALQAGELSGLGDDVFLLTLDEIYDLLSSRDTATEYLPARRETYARYRALPAYPMLVRGPFDAFRWAADPQRRSDLYDAAAAAPASNSDTIEGFAGAAGRVEGRVRVLDGPEEGDRLQRGEILVAVTTNVGWTPLFPRAAAVVTDVGAPLSHAAIVARELGIPAVVGCGSATTRLHTGDHVLVDGGRGIVEILHSP